MATMAKGKRKATELTAEQRKFLRTASGGWCTRLRGDYPAYVEQLVRDDFLIYDGIHSNAHNFKVTSKAVAALKQRRPEATIGTHSPSRSKDLAPRENREPDVTRYSGRVAARVRALRIARGMSVDELRLALERHGIVLVNSALYAYENGNRQINPDHYPALAKVLGVKSVREFLPGK